MARIGNGAGAIARLSRQRQSSGYVAAALLVSAACAIQGRRQHERCVEFRLQDPAKRELRGNNKTPLLSASDGRAVEFQERNFPLSRNCACKSFVFVRAVSCVFLRWPA